MKKIAAILLALMMLVAVSGCSLLGAGDSDAGDGLFGKIDAVLGTKSLWGKELSVNQVDIPFDPDAGEGQICVGMSCDGKRLLMYDTKGAEVPYLWDIEDEERIELYFGDDHQEGLSAAYADFDPAGRKLEGEELFEAVFTSGFCHLQPAYSGLNTLDHYMLVQAYGYGVYQFVLDTDTGALYSPESGMVGGIYDGEMLTYQTPHGAVSLQKLGSSFVREVDFGDECKGGDFGVVYATFLSDGSICAIMRDSQLDLINGQKCFLMVKNAEGEFERYSLGKIRFGYEPNYIVSIGSEWIIASGLMVTAANEFPYIINRNTGEVGRLAKDGMDFEIVDSEETGEDFGLVFQFAMADGETALFYDKNEARLGLFHADSMEACWLDEDEDIVFPVPGAITGNGYDRFVLFRGDESAMIEIEAE